MAFVNPDSGAVLGGISINTIDWDTMTGNLGYSADTHLARRGIAREAARQAAEKSPSLSVPKMMTFTPTASNSAA